MQREISLIMCNWAKRHPTARESHGVALCGAGWGFPDLATLRRLEIGGCVIFCPASPQPKVRPWD